MAQQTVCDLCDSGEPLKPSTGMYVIIIRKITKNEDGSQTYIETEFDVGGCCMAKLRHSAPGLK